MLPTVKLYVERAVFGLTLDFLSLCPELCPPLFCGLGNLRLSCGGQYTPLDLCDFSNGRITDCLGRSRFSPSATCPLSLESLFGKTECAQAGKTEQQHLSRHDLCVLKNPSGCWNQNPISFTTTRALRSSGSGSPSADASLPSCASSIGSKRSVLSDSDRLREQTADYLVSSSLFLKFLPRS